MSEVAEPKAAGEKAFKAQHAVEKIDAQPSGQDHVFNGEMPPRKRLADYMKGQDAAAYDQASKLPDQGRDDSIVDMGEEAEDPDAAELTEDPSSERPMMMGSLRAMAHNLQGIARYISRTEDPEEWFQNKLAGVAREMQTLYGYATAEVMAMGESLEEASCGCGPDCEHCGGDHADSEVGEECDCCGNMIKESAEKIDARRLSFKEKAKALGYVKADPKIEEDAFKAKAAHAKMAGKDKMKMGDKEFPVTMKKVNASKIVGKEVDESVEEAYRKPTPAEIAKDKERENRGKKRPSASYKSLKKKVYGNAMGGLKEEKLNESLDISKLSPDQLNKIDKLMTSLSKGNLSDAEKEKALKAAMTDMGVMKEETQLNEGILETIALIWFAGKVLPLIVGVGLMAVAGGLFGLVKILDKIDSIKKALKDRKVKAFIKKNAGKPIDAKMKAEIEKLFPPRVADKIRSDLESKGVVKEGLYEAQAEWLVTFKSGHKPQKVKGRNTAEAIKKAEKAAEKSGEKDSRLKAMYKDIKKVSEEAEEMDEISKDLAGRYIKKAQVSSADAGMDTASQDKNIRQKGIKTFLKRRKGVDSAVKRLMRKEEIDESLEEKQRQKQARKLTSKEMRRALQTAKAAPKDKVSLKKAPFDIPKESAELDEKFTIKTSILTLDSGEKVKVSRQDADLLNKFFRELNPRNSTEMRKVLVKDKDGYNEILGFAREAL